MKFINGKFYLTPMEASAMLAVSYKTLQRWADTGVIPIRNKGKRKIKKIKISFVITPTGYRYYERERIEKLASKLLQIREH